MRKVKIACTHCWHDRDERPALPVGAALPQRLQTVRETCCGCRGRRRRPRATHEVLRVATMKVVVRG